MSNLSEIKFACPVCGQHITCDPAKSGSHLACPTCFQNLIVPAPSTGTHSKLILSAALADSRPSAPEISSKELIQQESPRQRTFPVALVSGIAIVCAAAAGFALLGKPWSKSDGNQPAGPGAPSAPTDVGWKSDLSDVSFPNSPVAGRISGLEFNASRAFFEGGALSFRQGEKGSKELGLTISLAATEGGQLAEKSVNVDTKRDSPLGIVLRRRDYARQPVQKVTPSDYVLRIQFGQRSGDRIPGRMYFCAFDDERSWAAGNFEAEVTAPTPPRPNRPARPKR